MLLAAGSGMKACDKSQRTNRITLCCIIWTTRYSSVFGSIAVQMFLRPPNTARSQHSEHVQEEGGAELETVRQLLDTVVDVDARCHRQQTAVA